MKIVRPVCCGIDVHKSVLVATIASTGADGAASYEQRSFSTLNPDLESLRDWLLERECPEVCMESTGKYWIPVSDVLEGHVRIVVTHPSTSLMREFHGRQKWRYGGMMVERCHLRKVGLVGDMPARQRKFIAAWALLHEEDLAANWELCREHQAPLKIDPLR